MHRKLSAILAVFALVAMCGFKSEEWLAERSDDSDMLRLRAAFRDCMARVDMPAEDVTLPLEHHPDGTVKSLLTAKKAQLFMDTNFVWGEGIHVEQRREDGTIVGTIDAENCVIDRKTLTGWVAGSAKMTYGAASIKGRGIYFSFKREFIKIFSQSEIRTKGINTSPEKLLK